MFSYLRYWKSFLWIFLKHFSEKIFCWIWEMAWLIILSFFDKSVYLQCVLMLKWEETAQHSVEYDATAPDIAFEGRICFFWKHFRGSIARTAAGSVEFLSSLVKIAQTKINQFDDAKISNHNIFRFQISMRDSQRMEVLNRIDKLLKIHASLFFWQSRAE